MPVHKFSKPSHIGPDILPSPFLFLVFLQNCHNFVSSGEMVLMIFLKALFVQIVGAACGRAPAEANVWDVTVSAGGPQWGEASCALNAPSWKPKPLGVYCAGNNAQCRGQYTGNPNQWRKHPLTESHCFLPGGGCCIEWLYKLCMQPLSLFRNGPPLKKEKLR